MNVIIGNTQSWQRSLAAVIVMTVLKLKKKMDVRLCCSVWTASLALCLTWALHQVRGMLGAAAHALCVCVWKHLGIIFKENWERKPQNNSNNIEHDHWATVGGAWCLCDLPPCYLAALLHFQLTDAWRRLLVWNLLFDKKMPIISP